MRFKTGSKVEILGNSEGLSVEWRCAHIISGNGHTYNVQYDCSSMTSEASVERVPRKAIRPCPPPIEGVGSWEVNNFVEVYDAGSWKAATVLKFLGRDFYLVRLWVSCKVLKVHKVDMRVHQSWQNGQWIVKPMGPGDAEVGKSSWNLISNSYKVMPEVQQAINVCSLGLDVGGLQEPHLTPSLTLKRVSPYGSSPIEHYPRKKRALVNNGPCQDEDTLCSDAESVDVRDVDKGCTFSPEEVVAERSHRARVGGLLALLPMAKYDARIVNCAAMSHDILPVINGCHVATTKCTGTLSDRYRPLFAPTSVRPTKFVRVFWSFLPHSS
ncbi:Agenet-like domain [Sesbania bispinosa]|nr:Agenet-like domain [Sesbania bispinosa]